MNTRRFIATLLPLLLLATLLAATAQAALLDVGANVPRVVGSTPPNLGHGFPLWYRDTNRVPLQLCTDEAMCLFARPNPGQPVRFPDNMPDEVFFYSAESLMTTSAGDALLFAGIEGNILLDPNTGDVELVSFARVRLRIDTPVAGDYVVTTPFKQYFFNGVPAGARAINFTEDIGLGADGVFTGALGGNIGPFVYSVGAPFVTASGSYIGDNTPRQLLGSTFPSAQNPSNYFRVQGPGGFDFQTNLFSVTGKLYTEVTPTPLEVGKVSYTRSAAGVRVNAFATTQPLSNQTNPAAPFPQNFALTGALSALQLTSTGLPTQNMSTNSPADGRFFSSSALLPDPGALPAVTTVTNTADIPPTAKEAPLVDDVVIDSAMYNATTKALIVSAKSYDAVANPSLSLFMPGMAAPLGTLANGKLSVTFPVTDNTVSPAQTYNIPPEKVTVLSALGGSDTKLVSGLTPFTAVPTGTMTINGGAAYSKTTQVTLNLSATSTGGPVTQMQISKDGVNFFAREPFAATRVVTLLPGDGAKTIYVKFIDAAGGVSAVIPASITLDTVPPTGTVTINSGAATTTNSLVNLSLSASDDKSLVSMQFSNDGSNYFVPVPYANSTSFNLFPGDGVRTVSVRFIDAAGNVSAPASDSITVGSPAPTGTILINAGAVLTSSASVTLTISASGTNGPPTQMQFSKDGVNFFAYEPYATTRTVTLLAGDGERFIYVRFKDAAGNVSQIFSDSIVRDSTKPTGTIAFTTADPTTSATGTLTLTATDASGVPQMQFSKNGGAFFPLEAFSGTRTVSLTPGLNTLTVRFKDAAGNLSDPISATITKN